MVAIRLYGTEGGQRKAISGLFEFCIIWRSMLRTRVLEITMVDGEVEFVHGLMNKVIFFKKLIGDFSHVSKGF